MWYSPSGSIISRSLNASASRDIASRFSWSQVFARTSWQVRPTPELYILRPKIASLLLGSLKSVLGTEFSLIPGTNPALLPKELCLSETRRNCLTVEGEFPNVISKARGCLTLLDRRRVERLDDVLVTVPRVRRTVEFATGFGPELSFSRVRLRIDSDGSSISSAKGAEGCCLICKPLDGVAAPGLIVSNTQASSSTFLFVSVSLI